MVSIHCAKSHTNTCSYDSSYALLVEVQWLVGQAKSMADKAQLSKILKKCDWFFKFFDGQMFFLLYPCFGLLVSYCLGKGRVGSLITTCSDGVHDICSLRFNCDRWIQTIPYNSLFVARQNPPITSIDTEVILSSWREWCRPFADWLKRNDMVCLFRFSCKMHYLALFGFFLKTVTGFFFFSIVWLQWLAKTNPCNHFKSLQQTASRIIQCEKGKARNCMQRSN